MGVVSRMRKYTLNLPDELARTVADGAKARGLSKSAFMRLAIERALAELRESGDLPRVVADSRHGLDLPTERRDIRAVVFDAGDLTGLDL